MKKKIFLTCFGILLISLGFLTGLNKKYLSHLLFNKTITVEEFLKVDNKNKFKELYTNKDGDIEYRHKVVVKSDTFKPLSYDNTQTEEEMGMLYYSGWYKYRGFDIDELLSVAESENNKKEEKENKKINYQTMTFEEFLYDKNTNHWNEVYYTKEGYIAYKNKVILREIQDESAPLTRDNAYSNNEIILAFRADGIRPEEWGCDVSDFARNGTIGCYLEYYEKDFDKEKYKEKHAKEDEELNKKNK